MSRGFDWDAVYRMVVSDYGPATLISEAVSYTHLTLPTNREV